MTNGHTAMALKTLQHILILADDLDETRDFYIDVMGMTLGHRPPFKFDGYWLYVGDEPVVHLASAHRDASQLEYFDDKDGEDAGSGLGRSAVDHAAFGAEGYAEFVAHLDKLGIKYLRQTVPEAGQHQIFFRDPNGVRIEVNFDASEPVPNAGR